MPIFYQQEIDADTRLAVWEITEDESFFLEHVPLHRTITHPHKRLQHLAGRYLLQYLFPGFPIRLIQLADTRRPYLPGDAYHFSLSHCGQFAAALVSRKARVGIDVEVISPKVERIQHKFLHPDEQAALPEGDMRLHDLTLRWCCKEAVFKWWSYGKVDFSEQIRLDAFHPKGSSGTVEARFVEAESYTLKLEYRSFPAFCLAWAYSPW
jgi:4'-phosphopantetheinyl transferase EntD